MKPSALPTVPLFIARWANLWPPASFTEEFIGTSDEGQQRRLQEEADGGGGGCSWDGSLGGLGSLVFIGNQGLVFGALVLIFLLHVSLVSGVEAYWLAKVRRCSFFESVALVVTVGGNPLDKVPHTLSSFDTKFGVSLHTHRPCADGQKYDNKSKVGRDHRPPQVASPRLTLGQCK